MVTLIRKAFLACTSDPLSSGLPSPASEAERALSHCASAYVISRMRHGAGQRRSHKDALAAHFSDEVSLSISWHNWKNGQFADTRSVGDTTGSKSQQPVLPGLAGEQCRSHLFHSRDNGPIPAGSDPSPCWSLSPTRSSSNPRQLRYHGYLFKTSQQRQHQHQLLGPGNRMPSPSDDQKC